MVVMSEDVDLGTATLLVARVEDRARLPGALQLICGSG